MFGRGTSLAMLVRTIGNTSFNLMYVVLAGFIAMSVGDLPALVAGMAGGMLAIQGTSLAPQAGRPRACASPSSRANHASRCGDVKDAALPASTASAALTMSVPSGAKAFATSSLTSASA